MKDNFYSISSTTIENKTYRFPAKDGDFKLDNSSDLNIRELVFSDENLTNRRSSYYKKLKEVIDARFLQDYPQLKESFHSITDKRKLWGEGMISRENEGFKVYQTSILENGSRKKDINILDYGSIWPILNKFEFHVYAHTKINLPKNYDMNNIDFLIHTGTPGGYKVNINDESIGNYNLALIGNEKYPRDNDITINNFNNKIKSINASHVLIKNSNVNEFSRLNSNMGTIENSTLKGDDSYLWITSMIRTHLITNTLECCMSSSIKMASSKIEGKNLVFRLEFISDCDRPRKDDGVNYRYVNMKLGNIKLKGQNTSLYFANKNPLYKLRVYIKNLIINDSRSSIGFYETLGNKGVELYIEKYKGPKIDNVVICKEDNKNKLHENYRLTDDEDVRKRIKIVEDTPWFFMKNREGIVSEW